MYGSQKGLTQYTNLKGTMVDWSLHLFHDEGVDLADLLADASFGGQARIVREGILDVSKVFAADHDKSGLSVILPWSCSKAICAAAKDSDQCKATVNGQEVLLKNVPDDADNIRKLVLRRKADLSLWVVDCRRFAKVELSQLDGGVPGARSLGPGAERGRLPSGDEVSVSLESEVHSDIQTDSVENIVIESNATDADGQRTTKVATVTAYQPLVPCTQTSLNQNADLFFTECCLKVEARIALENSLCHLQSLMKRMTTPSTVTVSSSVTISDMGRDMEEELDNTKVSQMNKTMDIYFEELNSDVSSWKHSYYTVLGFFIVFLLIFLIVVGFLVFKLRGTKTVTPPASPGVNLAVPVIGQQRTRRGYSTVDDGDNEDSAPLTPATQQAQTFNY